MSNEKFIWCVNLEGTSGNTSFNTLSSRFGDGYEQSVSVGINSRKNSWSVSKTGKKSLITEIKSFFDRHKGADSFLWDDPFDGEIRVKAGEYSLTPLGADVWRISTTFTQDFKP